MLLQPTGKKLGDGAYSAVYSAVADPSTFGASQVAIKRNIIFKETDFTGCLREFDILYRLSGYPYIVSLKGISKGNPFLRPMSPVQNRSRDRDDKYHFVFEQSDCDACGWVCQENPSYKDIKIVLVHIFLALEYLHHRSIIHRDIKPSNILIFKTKDGIIGKLCDFGFAEIWTGQGSQIQGVTTHWYRAPEIVLNDPYYKFKVDVWSLGCVAYELMSKGTPFITTEDDPKKLLDVIYRIVPKLPEEKRMRELFQYTNQPMVLAKNGVNPLFTEWKMLTIEQQKSFDQSPGTYKQFISLLKNKLLVFDYRERCSSSQALEDPFFDGYRDLIDKTRYYYNQDLKLEHPIVMISKTNKGERKWAMNLAMEIFTKREAYVWYTHRMLFHAMNIFDRYLIWSEKNNVNCFPSQYYAYYQVVLRFYVAFYISIKYFMVMSFPPSFSGFIAVNKNDSQSIVMKEAEEFEEFLVSKVCNQEIYQETIFEAIDYFNVRLGDQGVKFLIEFYQDLTPGDNLNVKELARQFLKQHQLITDNNQPASSPVTFTSTQKQKEQKKSPSETSVDIELKKDK